MFVRNKVSAIFHLILIDGSLTTADRSRLISTVTTTLPNTQSNTHLSTTTPWATHYPHTSLSLLLFRSATSSSSSSSNLLSSTVLHTLSSSHVLLQPDATPTSSLVYRIPDEGSTPPSIPLYGLVLAALGAVLVLLLAVILVIGICVHRSRSARRRRKTGTSLPQCPQEK